MKVIPYILYLLLVGAHTVVLRDVTSFYGLTLNLPALVVFLVALYKKDTLAAWFGFLVGLVAFAGLPDRFGWHALVLAILAFVACSIKERLNLDSFKARILLVAGGVLVHTVIVLLINQVMDSLLLTILLIIAGTAYTTFVAWLFFLFKERVITVKKIRSIF